jgi:hypothetical protein
LVLGAFVVVAFVPIARALVALAFIRGAHVGARVVAAVMAGVAGLERGGERIQVYDRFQVCDGFHRFSGV